MRNRITCLLFAVLVIAFAFRAGQKPSNHVPDPLTTPNLESERSVGGMTARSSLEDQPSSVQRLQGKQKSLSPLPADPALLELLNLRRRGINMYKAFEAMGQYLKTFDPVGHTLDDLKSVFGDSYRARDDHILYVFSNGNDYSFYNFVMKDGKVVEYKIGW